MNNPRRSFLRKLTLGSSVLAFGTPALQSCVAGTKKEETPESLPLNLSCQENVVPGESLQEKLDFLEANGFAGFEQGCGGILQRADEIAKALTGRKVKISVACAGFEGVLISEKPEVQKQAMESIKQALINAGQLGALGLIVVPAFNGQTSMPFVEARALLVEQLKELGAHAAKNNTKIILEPLNRQEAWFLRMVADAASICRDVDSPGVGCMGDFWHMTWEETSDMGAFLSAGNYLTHVHCASRETRNMPGEDSNDLYIDGFRGLKMIGYKNYVSLECGSKGDKKITIPAAVKLLNEQWEKAV